MSRPSRWGKSVLRAGGTACAKARQAGELGSSWDLVRPGLWPYLVGRHQIKVTRVCWVKLHDVVHRLPVGHCHHPPADHLHALIQVDLWGGGGVAVRVMVHWEGAHGRGRPNTGELPPAGVGG